MLDFKTLRPLQAMAAAMLLQHKRLMFAAPRQFGGKTELGVRLHHDLAIRPYTSSSLFIAKDHPSAKKAAREKFMRLFDPKLFAINTELIYLKKHKTSAVFITSVDREPDRNRGGTYRFLQWTEVAFSKLPLQETITGVFDKIFAPTLTSPLLDGNDGYALLESTMNGKNGWKDLWDNAAAYGFKTLKIPLSMMVELGLISRAVYDQKKATTHPDVFAQEYECEWVTFQGRAYWEFTEDCIEDFPPPKAWQAMAAGIDWGWDPSATCCLFGFVEAGHVYIFDEHYANREILDTTAFHIDEKRDYWQIERWAAVADHEPDKIVELNNRGIECGAANKVNVLGVRMQIKELLWQKRIHVHPRCAYLIKDLEAATWDPKKEGELDYTQCKWGHYDAEAALRYLIRELLKCEADEPDPNPHKGLDSVSQAAWALERQEGTTRDNSWGDRW